MTYTNDMFDTKWAQTLTKYFPTALSTFVAQPDSVAGHFDVVPIDYGNIKSSRPISDPDDTVNVDVGFNPTFASATKEVQSIDLPCVSKGLAIPKKDYRGDPRNAMNHVRDIGKIVKEGIDRLFLQGSSDPVMRGVVDQPGGTTGTKNRPETCADVSTAGAWTTTNNMLSDLILMDYTLGDKDFLGSRLLMMPQFAKPMLKGVIDYTSTPAGSYVATIFGYELLFNKYVDPDGDKDSFDIYMLDKTRFHIGATPLEVEHWYDRDGKEYKWSWEMYMQALFDPLYDGTEWLKGVVKCNVDWDGS
jgi:hypothetical protein